MYLHFIAHLKTIDLTPDKTRVDKLLREIKAATRDDF